MPSNRTHKIVHSSAMYYQYLTVIHKSSKKLLTIQSVKCLQRVKQLYNEYEFASELRHDYDCECRALFKEQATLHSIKEEYLLEYLFPLHALCFNKI